MYVPVPAKACPYLSTPKGSILKLRTETYVYQKVLEMALGGFKSKMKSIPNKSLQSIINPTTKDASCNSTPRRSIRQLLDKTNAANNGMTEALVTSGLHNGSSGRGETNISNNTNENENMQQNSEVLTSQSQEIQSYSENTQELAHEANDISDVPAVSKKIGRGQTMGKYIMKAFVAISQKELNGEECDMIELYKCTHYKEKDGWSRVEAQENWELMISKRTQYTKEGIEKSVDEIVLEVLGHGSGYIKALAMAQNLQVDTPHHMTEVHDNCKINFKRHKRSYKNRNLK